jgi:hypothetical protein
MRVAWTWMSIMVLFLYNQGIGACTTYGFHSLSLQNYTMKLFSKVMVNRLKLAIPTVIDDDQTSFVHGHNIDENFVYEILPQETSPRNAQTGLQKSI